MHMIDGVIKRNNYLEKLIEDYRHTGKEPDEYVFGVKQAFLNDFYFREIPKLIFVRGRIHVTAFYIGLVIVTAAGGLTAVLL